MTHSAITKPTLVEVLLILGLLPTSLLKLPGKNEHTDRHEKDRDAELDYSHPQLEARSGLFP